MNTKTCELCGKDYLSKFCLECASNIHNINDYEQKYLTAIKQAKNNAEIATIINRIYEDGFTDGTNEPKDFETRLQDSKEQDMF